MNWIKKHYDQFALGAFALALGGLSVFIVIQSLGFKEAFKEMESHDVRIDKIKPLEMAAITDAREHLAKPVTWQPQKTSGVLYVSAPYIIDPATKQPRRLGGGGPGSTPIHPPVKDDWLIKYDQNVLANNILNEDPDKDGFTNLEEYLGADRKDNGEADSTDPTDPKSHPPYYTKLALKRYSKVPFLLEFTGVVNGDPRKDKPEKLEFQVNAKTLRRPSEFLKLGDMVKNTRFKLQSFQFKERLNEKTGVEEDISELTLLDTEFNELVVLVIGKITDSPESFAVFSYSWPTPAQEIRVRKLKEFVLRPAIDVKYKLIDINETEALIALPSGEKYPIQLISH